MDFFQDFSLGDEQIIWATKVFIVVFLTALVNFVIGRFIVKALKKTEKTHNLWDDAFIHAFRRPVRVVIWAAGLTIALKVAYGNTDAVIFSFVNPARDVLIIFSICWFALRFSRSVEENILTAEDSRIKLDKTTASAVAKLVRIAIMITGALIAMQTLGFSVSGVLAFGGIGGMAIGFASKDLLANFFGALMIYFDRPFKVGDWIRSPDKSIEGTVEDIGWRLTRIRTFDKRPLYVPNSVFTTIVVENPSRMTNRRINETIGVRYDDMGQVNKITKDVEEMLKSHKEIDTRQTLMVNLNNFNASSVDFFIYTFTKTTDWVMFHTIKQDIMLKIADIIDKNGAEMAFPTQTLHIASTPEKIEG